VHNETTFTALKRFVLLFAFVAALCVGCAKDTVSAPDGTARAVPDASRESGGAPPNEVAVGETEDSGERPVNNSAGAETASGVSEPSVSDAGPASPSGEVLLRLRLREGDVYTFDVNQEVTGMGMEAKMTITVAMKVLSVQPDATKIELRVAGAKLIEGNEAAQQGMKPMLDRIKGQAVELDVDARGRVQQQSVPPGSVFGDMLRGGLFRFTLPEAPVRVGSTWKHTTTASGVPGGSQPIETSYKVTGIEREGKRTVVVLEASAASTLATGPSGDERPTRAQISMKMNGTLRVDAATGLIRAATSDTETVVKAAGRTETMKMGVRVARH
jgi:hypothetical protein